MPPKNIFLYLRNSKSPKAIIHTIIYFIKRLLQRCLWVPMSDDLSLLILQNNKIYFNLKSSEIGFIEEIFIKKVYEQREDFVPKPFWTIIDIGANIGLFAMRQSRRIEKGTIFCIEPNPIVYKALIRNIQANNLDNILSYEIGMGRNSVKAKLFYNPLSTGSGSIMDNRFSIKEKNILTYA